MKDFLEEYRKSFAPQYFEQNDQMFSQLTMLVFEANQVNPYEAVNTDQVTGIPAKEVFQRVRISLAVTKIVFHSLAEQELVDAAIYYEEQNQGLGLEYFTEAEGAVNLLKRINLSGNPESPSIVN